MFRTAPKFIFFKNKTKLRFLGYGDRRRMDADSCFFVETFVKTQR